MNSLKFLPKDFTTLRTLFTIFFAVNLLFQDTSCSLALKYSSFLFKFFSFAFYKINFWFKIRKICLKISHFSQISHSKAGVGNFFSRRAICGKTKSFPGRIIKWIEFNIFNNYYCQGCSDWKAKKVYTSSDVLFFYEKEQKKVYTSSDVLFCTENISEAVP